jgi:hypothetical protein
MIETYYIEYGMKLISQLNFAISIKSYTLNLYVPWDDSSIEKDPTA